MRITVSLPAQAAGDEALTRDRLLAGTDCFRINCAHDDVDTWKRMVRNIHASEAETGRSAMIGMDLAGQRPPTMEVLLPDPPRRLRPGGRLPPGQGDPAQGRQPAAGVGPELPGHPARPPSAHR